MTFIPLQDHYSCYSFTSDSITETQYQSLCRFIEHELATTPLHPASSNMDHTAPAGFLFNLEKKLRWTSTHGEISMLVYDNTIVGVSCVEVSEIHPLLAVGGIRCWINKKHRLHNQPTVHLLSANLQWAEKNQMHAMMLTFNDYNKIIYDSIKRKSQHKGAGLSKIWSNWWNNCLPIDYPIMIKNTKQWCILKPIDHNKTCEIYQLLNKENI